MNELKFIHLGDVHMDFEDKYRNKIMPSLEQVKDYCKENKITAIIIPGDIWHRKQSYINKSGVPIFINWLREISKLVDFVFITKGNHDDVGSISLLHKIEPNVYSFEYPVTLGIDETNFVVDLLRYENKIPLKYIISLVPYPTKAGFVTETSIDNNNLEFLEKFEQLFELISSVTEDYNCPKILGFHGNVVGSRLSTGQTLVSQDIMVSPSTLIKADHDYYALNHIHLRQEIRPNMIYAGGIANFNWGETEQKSFEVIYFDEVHNNAFLGCESKQIMLESSRPMVKIEGTFTPYGNSDFDFTNEFDGDEFANAEYRFRCTVKENDRKLLTEEKINWLKRYFHEDVKIEWNIIPDERTARSENIMACKSLMDEIIEYAKIIDFDITDGIKNKINSLIEEKQEVYYETT